MAMLPPIDEMDARLYEELLNVITSKTQADAQFTHCVLPQSVDNIKVARMELRKFLVCLKLIQIMFYN